MLYYNVYYKFDECSGIEDFQLCKKWSVSNVTYSEFVDKVMKYKDSLKNENVIYDKSNNSNFISDLVNLYLKYFYLLVPLTVGLIFGVFYLFRYIKNKRNRFDI